MGGTGGRQADACLWSEFRRQGWENMAFPGLLSHGAVEEDRLDQRVIGEKRDKVVGDDGRYFDVRVEAARPDTGGQNVPEGDSAVFEGREAFFVGHCRRYGQNFLHNRPEGVPGVGIVSLRGQGGAAGHASENQKAGVGGGNGGKAADRLLSCGAGGFFHDQEGSKR